ncbi:ROK family protein [Sphaerisporangium viridialbum]|uniref:ROK family protein n=1 Tax=Sphaerisporangium viridialbum TaxID=46189 RepID=UPI003C7678B8
MSQLVGAVDWGGTWIRVALLDGDGIVHRERRPRPDTLPAQYATAAALLRQSAAAVGADPVAVGVGIAGIVQGDTVVSAINLGIRGPTPVARELRERLPCDEVFLVNDSQAAAVSLGRRWPEGLTAVISMGTGLGGAVLEDGRLVAGRGAAGDFGHSVVVVDGLECPCGGHGCLEMYVSGRALAAEAEGLAESGRSALLHSRRRSAGAVHAGDLQEAVRAGEAEARKVLDRAARHLAVGIRNVVATLDPVRVALAGAILGPGTVFGTALRERWESSRPWWCGLVLEHVVEDSDATLIGAALVADQRRHGVHDPGI